MVVIGKENNCNLLDMNFGDLEINIDEVSENTETESDADDCDEIELEKIFSKQYKISAEKALSLSQKYILHLSCTNNSRPTVCVGFNNSDCEVYSLEDTQINKIATFNDTSNAVEVKFNPQDNNLVYTGNSNTGIKLWDLRTTAKHIHEFIDSSVSNPNEIKPLLTFDVSPNNRLICAGTELFEGDAFLLFWDIRNSNLLGGYWESHSDDITKILFHPNDSNKLASGSTDGLINIYDLTQTTEDDAIVNCMHTESSVQQLLWYSNSNTDDICCVTDTNDVQLWDAEEATRYKNFRREEIAKGIKRKSAEHCYVANVHLAKHNPFLLAGSNWHKGECVRSLSITDNANLSPSFKLTNNKQRIRTSWYNCDTEMLITAGEECILSIWEHSSSGYDQKNNLKNSITKQKIHHTKPY